MLAKVLNRLKRKETIEEDDKPKLFNNKITSADNKSTNPGAFSEESSNCETCCNSETAKRSLKYYLENTTLHGLKYVAEDQITISERVYFGLSFVIVLILSGWFISNIYFKWSASPIIIATSHKLTPITDIPFPAITICNMNLAKRSKVEQIPKHNSNNSILLSLCSQDSAEVTQSFIGNWKSFKKVLVEVSPTCKDMLLYCSYASKLENCSSVFHTVLTDDGLCCTFNALHPKYLLRNYNEYSLVLPVEEDPEFEAINWSPEDGFDENLPQNFYPRASGGVGKRMGLTVILNVSSDEYYCSRSSSIGFKILVHNPAELPKISNFGFVMTAGMEARIPIEPVYQNAAPSVKAIKESIRGCLFSDEGDLVRYSTYSRTNCELECEARSLLEKCNCILYYLPRGDRSIRICGPSDHLCTSEVKSDIQAAQNNNSCDNCLPGCFELYYQTSLTSTPIVNDTFRSLTEYPSNVFNKYQKVKDITIMNFYYISTTFRGTTKTEIIGFTEFLSNIGGLLGLFLGFSIFSLIEIVYYVTIRPYCAIRTYRKELRNPKPRKSTPESIRESIGTRFSFDNKAKRLSTHTKFPYDNISMSRHRSSLHHQNFLNRSEQLSQNRSTLFPYME